MVYPIVLGSGRRLFDDTGDASVLQPVDTKTLGAGTLILTCGPRR